MVEQGNSSVGAPKRFRKAVKLISILYLLISIFHLISLVQIVLNWSVLHNLPLLLPPLYLAAEGLALFCSGIVIAWGLWKRRSWSRTALLVSSLAYCLLFWGKQIWLSIQAGSSPIGLMKIVLTIVGMGMIYLVLADPASRSYFKEKA